ncbi:cell division initiation protein [Streptomyces tsukubensis]|uniref:Cell division initiation protein n=1 Tax=Streptomyces tsukubensis TaxID=83656 RepID=A0A1V4A520_9ACTN|nr:cell division initiation protein [Streptomyces tsukubensis]OON76371.1 cell division initiation protein [Streptomyces tsukubensis]QFR95946.1 cell division initiation protein [Streptomyces tsukubensis]
MDVQKKLDEIVATVGGARSMPMSASCVVNRADLLAMLEEVRQALPGSLAQAQELIGGREQMVEEARQEAERIIRTAHDERGTLISDTAVARQSQGEADRILAEARKEAEEVRVEADDYVDSKLANFEVVLTKTLGSVGRGREKLLGTGQGLDDQGYEDPDFSEAPERSHDPETLRQRADAYVDVKLGAFEAVLAKTLDAVGRGRQTLHGRVPTDELGLLDAAGGTQHTSDADYLADLAGPSEGAEPPTRAASAPRPAPTEPQAEPEFPAPAPQIPAQQPSYVQPAAYAYQDQQQDPYGYQQAPYGAQDPYGYVQQDPYAYQQQGYPQQGYDPTAQSQPHQPPASLDETSLFDTSMISAEQLRQYEQQRGYDQNR